MIIWINGSYGVGKSTIARELHKLNPESFIFDAESVGNAIRDNMPKQLFNGYIFEGYDLWFKTIVELLKAINKQYKGDIYIPMTLVYPDSFDKIANPLREEGITLYHVLLEANYEIIHDRILNRGETEDCWCMQHINMCLTNQHEFKNVRRISTINKTPFDIANKINSLLF